MLGESLPQGPSFRTITGRFWTFSLYQRAITLYPLYHLQSSREGPNSPSQSKGKGSRVAGEGHPRIDSADSAG